MATVGIATGAASGMGAACAQRMVDTVDHLLVVDLREEPLAAAVAGLAGTGRATVEGVALDVTDADALDRLVARVRELGTLGPVAHAAGISPSMADWRRVIEVDLVGSARLTDALFAVAGPGTAVVCFASCAAALSALAGPRPPEALAALDDPLADGFVDALRAAVGESVEDAGLAYSWAKVGVQRLVEREAVRYGRAGARINSMSPGIIDTPMGRAEAAAQATNDFLVSQTPLGREGRPEELAAAVMFLCSDEASFVNGTDLLVDGGVVAALRTGSIGIPRD